jgi:hypothetical protein
MNRHLPILEEEMSTNGLGELRQGYFRLAAAAEAVFAFFEPEQPDKVYPVHGVDCDLRISFRANLFDVLCVVAHLSSQYI